MNHASHPLRHRVDQCFHQICALDAALCLKFNRCSQRTWVRCLFCTVSRLGDGWFWYAVILGILLAQGVEGLYPTLHMMIAGGAGTLVYKLVKHKTSRPRPFEVHQAISLSMQPLDRFSFPSGHTLHAVIFMLTALGHYPSLAWLLVPFTLLVAASRVILGLHYPSDVLVGALIGGSIAGLSFLP